MKTKKDIPLEARICDLCGEGNKPYDTVKIYTKSYGSFEGMAHTACVKKLNKEEK